MDQDIITHMRQRYNLLIGERMAEEAKMGIASGEPIGIRGRDLKSGLAAEVAVSPQEILEAMSGTVNAILDAVTDTIEETPPELVADLMVRGIVLAGGGAMLPGLVEQLTERTRMQIMVADDPMGCVVRGTGKVLGDLDRMRKAFAESQARRVPPRR
jgi:rod shape-determining protein MreB